MAGQLDGSKSLFTSVQRQAAEEDEGRQTNTRAPNRCSTPGQKRPVRGGRSRTRHTIWYTGKKWHHPDQGTALITKIRTVEGVPHQNVQISISTISGTSQNISCNRRSEACNSLVSSSRTCTVRSRWFGYNRGNMASCNRHKAAATIPRSGCITSR